MARRSTYSTDGVGRGAPLIGNRSCAALLSIAIVCGISSGRAQESRGGSVSCIERNRLAVAQMDRGQFAEAQASLNAANQEDGETICKAIAATNLATLLNAQGRYEEAERFAVISVRIWEKHCSPDDPMMLQPLQALAYSRLQQGKIGKAREAVDRLLVVRLGRPRDAARVHCVLAVVFQAELKLPEAEAEYLLAIRVWEQSGLIDTAEAGSLFSALAGMYITENRLEDARVALDRSLDIFAHTSEAMPVDRIKMLTIQASLSSRQGAWDKAEAQLRRAVEVGDAEGTPGLHDWSAVLGEYAIALRKNHHAREARAIEMRLKHLNTGLRGRAVVDVTELLVQNSRQRK